MKNFYTIGYGGRAPQDFLTVLQNSGVEVVVDVRLRPDRAYSGFYKKATDPSKGIEALLARAGIGYVLLVKLGNQFMGCSDWQDRYRRLLEKSGDVLTKELHNVASPFSLLCAEKSPAECHRRLLSEYLVLNGFTLLGHL